MKKAARELKAGEVTAIMGSQNGNWFVKNWTIKAVTDSPEFGYTEVQLALHSASDEALRIDAKREWVAKINHRDEKYELFTMCNGPSVTKEVN